MDPAPSEALICEFTVRGKPEPRGSKFANVLYKDKARKVPVYRPDGSIAANVVDTNDGASKRWMKTVEQEAFVRYRGKPLEDVALDVVLVFFLERPEGHYGSGRNRRLLKDNARALPTVKPDLDKLARPVLDALTGLVWKDDSLITGLSLDKRYAVPKSSTDAGQGVVIKVGYSPLQSASDLGIDLRTRWVEPLPSEPAQQDDLWPDDGPGMIAGTY